MGALVALQLLFNAAKSGAHQILHVAHQRSFVPLRVDTTFYNAGVYGVKPSSDLWISHGFVMLPDHVEVGHNYEDTEHGQVPLETDNNL